LLSVHVLGSQTPKVAGVSGVAMGKPDHQLTSPRQRGFSLR
jgi:hypothetical protein